MRSGVGVVRVGSAGASHGRALSRIGAGGTYCLGGYAVFELDEGAGAKKSKSKCMFGTGRLCVMSIRKGLAGVGMRDGDDCLGRATTVVGVVGA